MIVRENRRKRNQIFGTGFARYEKVNKKIYIYIYTHTRKRIHARFQASG